MKKDIVADRQRAYAYIKYLFNDMDYGKNLFSDVYIAKSLDAPVDDVCSLREGTKNPSTAIVNGVKEKFKDFPDSLLAIEIEQLLVNPFA